MPPQSPAVYHKAFISASTLTLQMGDPANSGDGSTALQGTNRYEQGQSQLQEAPSNAQASLQLLLEVH